MKQLLILSGMLLLLAAIFDMEYGYYVFIKVVASFTTGLFLFLRVRDVDKDFNVVNLAILLVFLAFNPLFPIPFEKDTWKFVDVAAAALVFFVATKYPFKQFD